MRSTLLILAVALTVLSACDTSNPAPTPEPDLFLLPEIVQIQDFAPPRDSVVTLPTETFEFSYAFSGPRPANERFGVNSTNAIDIGGFVVSQGYQIGQINEIQIVGSPQLRLVSGASNLSFINEISSLLIVDNFPYSFSSRSISSTFPGNVIDLVLAENPIPPNLPNSQVTSQIRLTPRQPLPSGASYEVQISVALSIKVRADFTPSTIDLQAEELNVRDILRENEFDTGDVVRARYTSLRINPVNSALFAQRVARVTVLASTGTGNGAAIGLGTVNRFNETLPIDADVADVVRRTGRIRLSLTLDLNPGPPLADSSLAFGLEAKLRMEVPQPTTGGG